MRKTEHLCIYDKKKTCNLVCFLGIAFMLNYNIIGYKYCEIEHCREIHNMLKYLLTTFVKKGIR